MKLNIGCGNDWIAGYTNVDSSYLVNPDMFVDLEKPLPFNDSSVSEVLAYHVLEHINNFIPLMLELHRVCEDDALIKIKTPFYSSWGQFNDPTHVRFFSPFTFDYFNKGNYSHQVNTNKDLFDIVSVRINFGVGRTKALNFLFNPLINFSHRFYCRFFAWVFPAAEIVFELRKI